MKKILFWTAVVIVPGGTLLLVAEAARRMLKAKKHVKLLRRVT